MPRATETITCAFCGKEKLRYVPYPSRVAKQSLGRAGGVAFCSQQCARAASQADRDRHYEQKWKEIQKRSE